VRGVWVGGGGGEREKPTATEQTFQVRLKLKPPDDPSRALGEKITNPLVSGAALVGPGMRGWIVD
jgi:hypothetical protein